jgi:hypothetical protein
MMRRAWAAAALAPIVLEGTALASDPPLCGTTDRPWVELRAGDEDVPSNLASFVELLRTELASRGFDLCAAGPRPHPSIAAIQVMLRSESVTLDIEVRDALTAKRVARNVDLSTLPADGRPLAIALAADELLRASWAELALRTAPPPAAPVPPQVIQVIEETSTPVPRRPSTPHVQLGVGFAVQQFALGTTLFGGDAHFGIWLTSRFEIEGRFGLRTGPSVTAADGAVQPGAWSVGGGASLTLTPPEAHWGIDAVARFDIDHVTFVPTPQKPSTGTVGSETTPVPGAGARAWIALLPTLRLGAEAIGCVPLRAISAEDAGARVTGVGGAGWGAELGLWSVL